MENTYCGAECTSCAFHEKCKGCVSTCGKPFGGNCIAAEYLKTGGKQFYSDFKQKLLEEINGLLSALNYPPAEALYELPGQYVNLPYLLPNGEEIRFLDDKNIYLGCQILLPGMERCCGVVAGLNFILISTYAENGAMPELVCFKQC